MWYRGDEGIYLEMHQNDEDDAEDDVDLEAMSLEELIEFAKESPAVAAKLP